MKCSLIFLCVAVVAVVVATDDSCTPKGAADLRADPYDCSVFYVCANKKLVKFTCNDSVFDPLTKACVPKGSIWDKCTPKPRSTVGECTPGSTAIIPHPTKCAQYYDCSDNTEVFRWPLHLKECPYSRVFNTETKRCEHYSMVKCGEREEPISHCDYDAYQCRSAHCIPCNVRYPSCKGLPDGLNPWVGREVSPYFVVCNNNRTVYQGQCHQDNSYYLFDAVKKTCVELV
ncbi:peritrophin-1-like [Gigantopelta aegis]|uniref:peritrophin-1-like n=1 Tax=Gigantopelta aegis TaxID=1735272 RepID=UPI001B8885DE|nr:peritrophin-1-like [Gigantopelta aegis]